MNETREDWIGRYLAGEGSTEERGAFMKEIDINPALQDQYLALKKVWDLSTLPDSGHEWNTDEAWKSLNNKIKPVLHVTHMRRRSVLPWAIAASLLTLILSSFFFWSNNKPVKYTYDSGSTKPLELVDGSKVFLNKGASINVYSFSKKRRIVELTGEAFFDVVNNNNKPFIVQAGATSTEVVGTKFNLRNIADRVSLYVSEGKVIFHVMKGEGAAIALTSGEGAVFENKKINRIVNPSPNMHAWHSRELHFRDMPLSDVIADITSYFNMDIAIENDGIKNCRVTIPLAFKEPEINSVLSAVAMTIDADFVVEGSKCTIRGGRNCPY